MTLGARLAVGGGIVLLLALAACGGGEQAYFPRGSSVTDTSVPITLGDTALIGINRIEARAGDRLVLTDLVPVEMTGSAEITPFVVVMDETGGGGVGAWSLSRPLMEGRSNDEILHPLPGFVLTEETGTVQVVLGISMNEPGQVAWDKTSLAFTVDGKEQTQAWPYGGLVCAGDPVPACDLSTPAPSSSDR